VTTRAGSRATLQKEPHEVAAMFDGVAERYDLTNDVLSLGQTRLWRRAVARAVDARRGDRVLDLAAGTGSSALPFAAAGAHVVAADFSLGMLQVGRRQHPELGLVAGDALRLPFADETFDAVTACATSPTSMPRSPRWPGSPGRADGSSCASSATRRGHRSAPSTAAT
jgi:ubiquinone/menaquinone biosynthesis C-methylase UbiE